MVALKAPRDLWGMVLVRVGGDLWVSQQRRGMVLVQVGETCGYHSREGVWCQYQWGRMKKAGSRREPNPGHLWLELPVLFY